MVQWIFVTALTLVSALALALVYGLGGYFALAGHAGGRRGRRAGAAAHPPLRAADRAGQRPGRGDERAGQLRAGLRDPRPAAADRREAGRPAGAGTARSSVEFDDVRFAYPSADKVSLASLEEVAVLDTRGGVEVLHGVSFRAEPGQMVALVGSSGAGKSTIAQLAAAAVRRRLAARSGSAGVDVRDLTVRLDPRRRSGMVTQDGHLFHESIRANLLLARPEATEDELWDALRRARLDGAGRRAAGRAGHRGRRARLPALRRRAAAADDRPAAAGPAAGRDPGRGDRAPGLDARRRRCRRRWARR